MGSADPIVLKEDGFFSTEEEFCPFSFFITKFLFFLKAKG